MSEKIKLTGQDHNVDIFRQKMAAARKGKGSIITIAGEAGFGKTNLLNAFLEMANDKNSGVIGIYVESQSPIGKFKVGNLQPLLPFSRAIEQMLDDKTVSPEKKFALNLGMTFLSALPLAGDVFYAVKEMGRDYRQFKKDKSSLKAQNISSAAADYFDTICSYAEKAPLVILMDDMHFADAQSAELLNLFADKISAHPVLIVLAYRSSVAQSQALPLLNFLQQQKTSSNVLNIELSTLSPEEISEMCSMYFPDYKPNEEFENWIREHSYSVPGIVAEYLRYFSQYSPFGSDGELVTNFKGNEFLPATLQGLFSQALNDLTEDEKNTLSICSCEGMEFTTTIVSQLLNLDMLATIKKLRSLQNKTGIIKSVGAHKRYGIKSTIYRFTQAFYQSYFEKALEYEEHVAIHGQIASLLKQKYDEAASEEVRRQIAPYIAAHSSEAGDEDTVKSMLLVAAEQAESYGSPEMVQSAYESFRNLESLKYTGDTGDEADEHETKFLDLMKRAEEAVNTAEEAAGSIEGSEAETNGKEIVETSELPVDFESLRRNIVNEYLDGEYFRSAEMAVEKLESGDRLHLSEKAQLMALAVNAYIMADEYESAERYASSALEMVASRTEPISECFVYNACSLLAFRQNRMGETYKYLTKAAERAQLAPPELRLLTMATIGILTRESSPEKARKYLEAAKLLSVSLNFDEISTELENI